MSKTTNDFCSAEKIQICISKNKICNTKTGRCINKPKTNASANSDKVSTSTKKVINTKKTILDFIKELGKKKYKTADEVINNIFNKKEDDDDAIKVINEIVINEFNEVKNNASKKGYIYELLWDICIKFGITDFTKEKSEHAIGNFNIFHNFKNIKEYINEYLKQGYISSNSGGYSDITFRNQKTIEELIEGDETIKNIKYEHTYNLITVKYFENENYKKNIKDYDIQNLCPLINQIINNKGIDKENVVNILLFVKDKKKFIENCKKSNESSNVLIKYISPRGNYENVYDLQDLEIYYAKLIKILSDFDFLDNVDEFNKNYLNICKKKFIPRFHQELFIEKITDLIKKNKKQILVGAIPRSGKTFIMAGTILADVIKHRDEGKKSFNNYVIITPAPNETLNQYEKAFNDYYDFANNDIVTIDVKDENKQISSSDLKGEVNKHNVFLISKQRLGFKDKEDNTEKDNEYLKKDIENIKKNINKYFGKDSKFKIIFLDEAHFGMSTDIAGEIFKELDKGNTSYKIYVTATYNKPKRKYEIDDKNIIKWDLNDIKIIKNITTNITEKNFAMVITHFTEKFGKKILTKVLKKNGFILPKPIILYDNTIPKSILKDIMKDNNEVINNIIKQYKHFPEPILLTSVWDKDFFDNELEKIGTNKDVGFDMLKLFMVNGSGEFKNKQELTQLLEYYFGYYVGDDNRAKENNFYEKKYEYKKKGIIPIIEEICTNKCRTLQPQHKTTQLWFLPAYNISKITNSLIELLKTKFPYIFEKHMFYIAVDKNDGNKINNYENVIMMKKAQDIKKEIENLENKLLTADECKAYEGLIILTGNRLQLGISLKNVDIVSLFTNITASDAIYQMLFRSMTEIEEDIECDGKNYCGRKKYGFMVDLDPQRTLYTIEYLTDMYFDYDKYKSKGKKYELIANLINIDKHKFIDKYNRDDIKGYEKYVQEFFKKLTNAWDAKTENIKNLLLNKNIFNSNVFKTDYDITNLFTDIEREIRQKKKELYDENENKIQKGVIKKKIEDVIKPEKNGKKIPSTPELWAYLFAEVISILSLITTYTDDDGNECSFNIKTNDNFIYELEKILENMNKDTDLKDIFLHSLKKRIIIKNSINEEDLYNMVKNGVYNIRISERKQGGDLEDLLSINKEIQMRKRKLYNINEPDKLLEFINDNLKPKDVEKKIRGEVFTPMKLVGEMLDTLPKEIWKNPNLKWLDPAAGIGNFPVAVYMRLMEGLINVKGYEDEEKRRKHILENMLYMVEIDKTNVFMMRKIFCGKIYKLNIFEGSFINFSPNKNNIFKKINIDIKFDIILGNPPFQYKEENKQAQPIWHLFIKRSYEELLKDKGYLLFVHPSGWRDIDGITRFIYNYIKAHNLIYLSMTSFKESQKIFSGVSTNFDYYLVQNIKINKNITSINDIDNIEYKVDLNNWDFIPSGKFNQFKKLLTKKNKVIILHDRSMYGTDKKNTNKEKNKIFKYPICNTINKDGKINFIYSNNIDGHFGIPKVIWSNGAGAPIIDDKGTYGLTEFSSAIVDEKQNLQKIKNAMISKKFINLMKYLVFKENHTYNYKIIALFKKDFYKYFLPKTYTSLSLSKNKLNKKPKYNSI